MKKLTWVILLISQFVFAATAGIIPTPQQIELSAQEFQLSSKVEFKLVGDLQNLKTGQESQRNNIDHP